LIPVLGAAVGDGSLTVATRFLMGSRSINAETDRETP
jgi:hypothetical protein